VGTTRDTKGTKKDIMNLGKEKKNPTNKRCQGHQMHCNKVISNLRPNEKVKFKYKFY
jgi:hypothetical protein